MSFQKVLYRLEIQTAQRQVELTAPGRFPLMLHQASAGQSIDGSLENRYSSTVVVFGRNQKTVFFLTAGSIAPPATFTSPQKSGPWNSVDIQTQKHAVCMTAIGCLVENTCIDAKLENLAADSTAEEITLYGFAIRGRWGKLKGHR